MSGDKPERVEEGPGFLSQEKGRWGLVEAGLGLSWRVDQATTWI